MVKDIIKYPQTPSIEFNAPVRFFNEELFTLIEDLKDTIIDNDLQALSAYQIGNPYSVIVLKNDDGTFLEIINARIFYQKNKITTNEITPYFGDIEVSITRDKNIKIAYEDRAGKQQYLTANDDLAILLQRKIDYNFGANFRVRLNEKEQDAFDMKLEYGSDVIINNSCPTVFHRDKILKGINIVLLFSLLAILSNFILSKDILVQINEYINIGFFTIASMIVVYIFYAYYEGKKYTNCVSCQIGNIIGTAMFHSVKLIVLIVAKFLII